MKPPMDPNVPDDPLDRELEAYLSGRSDVSQRYRSTATQEPPTELDRTILAQARAAVETAAPKVVRLPTRKIVGWIAPFAAAAGVLLTLSIVNQTGLAPVTLQEQRTVVAEPALPAPVSTSPFTSVLEKETASLVEKPLPPPSAPPPTPAPVADVSVEQAKVENVIVDPQPVEAESQRALNVPLKAQPPQQLFKLRSSKQRSLDSVQPAVGAAAAGAVRQEAVATVSSVVPVEPPPPEIIVERKKDASAVQLREPKAWLEDIRKLRAAGKEVEAQAELKRFNEVYPDHFERNPQDRDIVERNR